MYTVKEVSKLLNLSEHTIRYYTDQGLVPSIKRSPNNNRLFDEESLNWLFGIKYLKQCGMPIKIIKHYVELCLIGDSTIKERYKIILNQKEIALTQLEEARKRVEYMEKRQKTILKLLITKNLIILILVNGLLMNK